MSSSKRRLQRLEAALETLVNKADPNLCTLCGSACKTFNQEWFERTGEEVYDTCMNRYVVLKGEGLKDLGLT